MIGIYSIESPTNKIYIGQSWDIDNRFNTYRNLKCKGQKKLYNSFIKYGIDNHIFNIIYICNNDIDQPSLDSLEIEFISLFTFIKVEMMNLTKGGRGCRGYKFTNEDRAKISKAKLGRKFSEEHKAKLSSYSKNRSTEHTNKIRLKNSKIVEQYTLNGDFIREWPSLYEAEISNNGYVRGCVNGSQRKAGGYFWRYKSK